VRAPSFAASTIWRSVTALQRQMYMARLAVGREAQLKAE
jgi:hypothetical protein